MTDNHLVERLAVLALALALVLASPAAAAPFCAISGSVQNCWYGSMASCTAATGSAAACVLNQKEAGAQSGTARFCLTAPGGAACNYFDARACEAAARAQGGSCLVRGGR